MEVPPKKDKENNLNTFLIIYFVTFGVSIFLFCYKASLFDSASSIDYQKFDSFGSFLSGVVSILTIYLLYKTFKEQVVQSNVTKGIYETDIISRYYSEITSEINNLEYKNYRGLDALYNFDDAHRKNPNSVMNHLCLIFILFETAISFVEQAKFLDKDKQSNELTRLYLLFYSKLTWPVYQNIYDKLYEDYEVPEELRIVKGLKRHNDSVIIFNKYKELTAKTYAFLLKLELVTLPTTKPKMLAIINREENFEGSN